MESKNDSNIKHLMLMMNQAFENSSHKIDPLITERLAELVYQVMSARYRIFHTMEHIFNTAEGMDGIFIFSSLFHDMVYYQVDKRIHPLLAAHLSEFQVNEKSNECILPDLNKEHWLSVTGKIFGFQLGQALNPFNGLNEFLSAVVAARVLSPYLSEWEIIQIIACIEATIPFRPQNDEKTNSFNLLHERLVEINQRHQYQLTELSINQAVKDSIHLANQDVCSFYSKNFGEFISGTWNLILENNPIFNNPLYTIFEYNKALQKVRLFFSVLKYEHVVHEWGGYPDQQTFLAMKKQVSINLENAILYIDMKIVAISILEVIANSSGGDAPYFLLIGQSSPGSSKAPIERYFPEVKNKVNPKMNSVVYDVLKKGRNIKESFDFSHSPIAAYLYENLTEEEVGASIILAQEYHKGKITPEIFIQSFRREVIQPIIHGVGEVSWSRKISI